MRIYKDDRARWCIERNDGEVITLDWNESSMLYEMMDMDVIWENVVMRLEEHPRWDEIEAAKEDILDDLKYKMDEMSDDEMSDMVYNIVGRWVDLDETENDDD